MIEIIKTTDGSHSLLNTDLQETYHSVHGAIQESQHVFIGKGLSASVDKEIRILEIGFGTGLNALLTWMYANESKTTIIYDSWELYPLDPAVINQLNFGEILNATPLFQRIHEAPWNECVELSPSFTLFKRTGNILTDNLRNTDAYQVVYYDAFAPAKQPEMWTYEVLKKVTDQLAEGGIFVTYCAKGQVKRDLKSLGLTVETLDGPPGKKEMIRARREIKN